MVSSDKTIWIIFSILFIGMFHTPIPAAAGDWPQFRGPNGSGVAEGDWDLPVEFSPQEGVMWSLAVPPGISSPVVVGDRIYITGLRGKDLLTLAIDKSTGKILWERPAPAKNLEMVHSTSSPAAPTPASDGEQVVVFFGSYGLIAYDPQGNELWKIPLAPFNNTYGMASSPILTDSLVILNCDQDQGSFLLAADKKTGKVRYRVERPGFPRGYSTPIIWNPGSEKQIIVPGTLRLKAYALRDGRELWSADGLARIVNPTPVLGEDLLFVSSYTQGGDAADRITMPPFGEYLEANDADKNGLLSEGEVPRGNFKSRFWLIDTDKNGFITRAEWENMARIFEKAQNAIYAFRSPGPGKGVSLVWKHERGIPYIPSPLYYRGLIYLIKDGGILTALSAAKGEVKKMERVPTRGMFYSSPVAGAGKIYLANLAGEVAVISAGPDWKVLSTNSLGDRCAATPAIVDGRLYYRTNNRMFCFANPEGKRTGH